MTTRVLPIDLAEPTIHAAGRACGIPSHTRAGTVVPSCAGLRFEQ
jgi:hypothetical protein